MAKYRQADFSNIKTISIKGRKSKVHPGDFAKVFDPRKGSFASFVQSFPHILVAEDLRSLVGDIAQASKNKRQVIAMLGAHVIKVGLSPIIIDLMKRNVITCVCMNSAAAIHDVETAKWGRTSEDVEENISDGRFGMSKETGEFINTTLCQSYKHQSTGYGEAIGKALRGSPNAKLSILASCYSLGIPATVHAAIGTDIVHQQPTMDGAATGELSFRDFKILCEVVKKLRGGIVLNIGSAVILPEVFLKALTVARNLGAKVQDFSTANFDMIQHYRPRMNIVHRPTRKGGKGYLLTGHHEIMIPLLAAMIKERLSRR